MNTATILVIEDDNNLREAIADTLELANYSVLTVDSAESAIALMGRQHVDLVLTDVNLGKGMNGHELLEWVQRRRPDVPVLLMTAYGTIHNAVDAMRSGAADYLVKPFAPELLISTLSRFAAGQAQASDQQPIAEAKTTQRLFALAQRVAQTDATVLIGGESGTGKEVLARYIHAQSDRADKPFVAINCAAIPENMLEATLFGYEKGAFTGALQATPGKFEQANGGTLLLDEISEMDIGLQAKLLRVLQEREVERLGGRKTLSLDVRVLATSNRNLREDVKQGQFREDLYYRLNVFPLRWQPLRERSEDIVPLAQHLLAKHAAKMYTQPVPTLMQDAKLKLQGHSWPGNVRELDNVIQRALILAQGSQITAADIQFEFIEEQILAPSRDAEPELAATTANQDQETLGEGVKQREFSLILDALRHHHGNRQAVADNLGISPRTLRYKMARMRDAGIVIP